MLGFFLEATIGLIGFWFLEVSSLLFVYMLFNFFLSGHMFPLDMLPAPWDELVELLPLQVPGLLSRRPCSWARSAGRSWPGAWGSRPSGPCSSSSLSRVMFHRGLKRYSGYGG